MRRAVAALLIAASIGPAAARAERPSAWSDLATMSVERFGPVAARLADGRVLVAAGDHHVFDPDRGHSVQQGTRAVDLYDPLTGVWTPAAPTNDVHGMSAVSVTLPDGKLFIIERTAELYDPATGTWTSTSPPRRVHEGVSAAALPDGRVLVAGRASPWRFEDAEIYDPSTDTWALAARPFGARLWGSAVSLATGEVLWVACTLDGERRSSAELYNPQMNSWTLIPMREHRCAPSVTVLADGRVLVAGGSDGDTVHPSAEIFDPATLRFTNVSPMPIPRAHHAAVLLEDGSVLVTGGTEGDRVERYYPSTDHWATVERMQRRRYLPAAVTTFDGRALVIGGYDGLRRSDTSEVFDPFVNLPTTLDAERLSLADGVAARLVASGPETPIEGAPVVFSARGRILCEATTDEDGWARCALDESDLPFVLAALGYRAEYFGDSRYLPSSDSHTGIAP